MKALILCDGEPPTLHLLEHCLVGADLIIATDGAVRWALSASVRPHVVIGDFDSLPEPEGDWEVIAAGAHEEQENSDGEKALRLALERGATEIVLLGATGRRLDHTLGNVSLLATYHRQADLRLVDDYGVSRVISGTATWATYPGERISLVPLTLDVVVRTRGLKWPLSEALPPGTRGLSNEAVGGKVSLEVTSGAVLVMTVTGI
jgi:thiamine pyrophosphokinase